MFAATKIRKRHRFATEERTVHKIIKWETRKRTKQNSVRPGHISRAILLTLGIGTEPPRRT